MTNCMKYLEEIKMKYLVLFMFSGSRICRRQRRRAQSYLQGQKTEIDFEGVDVVGELVRATRLS